MFAALLISSAALFADAKFTTGHDLTHGEYSFEQYLHEAGKRYDGHEYEKRREIFESNLSKIRAHNKLNVGYTKGVNKFTDQTDEELKHTFGGNKHALNGKSSVNLHSSLTLPVDPVERKKVMASLPKSKDWRDDGVVTPVKDQGKCGSCWAHAAVETIESFLAINTGVVTEVSQQELVACMPNDDNCGGTGGCEGATAELAFDYLSTYGLPELWQYGYETNTYWFSKTNSNGACNRDLQFGSESAVPRAVTADGYTLLPRNSYDDLMYAIATTGPVAVNVDASEWHSYESGVFTGCVQDPVDINHVVQLVGYGTCPETNQDYWLVRNSWTSQWGMDGYIRIARQDGYCGQDVRNSDGVGCDYDPQNVTVCGACGIMYDASYPVGTRLWSN